jgi:pimeloyl-ACP methyl ester carboxylesterase
MKFFLNFIFAIIIFNSALGQSKTIDTLVDVGGYKLHFYIFKGKRTPILFEAGGGEDATTWKNILTTIADITGTTLITYDRTGFGKSTFDASKHGILNGMSGLETGLQKLGYTGNIILVAHSQGGLYATLYANRHPDKVKAGVLIDATTSCFYEKNRLAVTQQLIDAQNNESRRVSNPGSYYQGADFSNNINTVREVAFPKHIPVIDFVADYPPFSDKNDITDWKRCHQEFVNVSTNRTGITAYGCGHFIFNENPPLVIHAIVKSYITTLNKTNSDEVLKRALDYSMDAANNGKKEEIAYRHSEDDLNSWGYRLLQQGNLQRALEVFKLNVALNPDSWNVYDSYAEALLKNGQKEQAIKMYQKSIELNPANKNGKTILEELLKNK